jgi:hypothetical protein
MLVKMLIAALIASNANTWAYNPNWAHVFAPGSAARTFVSDFNGDNRDDFLFTWADGTWWVGQSTGAAFTFNMWKSKPAWGGLIAGTSPTQTFVGDFTGEGRSDFFFTGTNGDWVVGKSTGTNFDFKLFATQM